MKGAAGNKNCEIHSAINRPLKTGRFNNKKDEVMVLLSK